MYAQNMVICDREQQYARNLLRIFSDKKEAALQLYLFHTLEELKKFSDQKKIHILLMGEEYSQKQREEIPADARFVLIKGKESALSDEETGINRYQCGEDIWSQILGAEPEDREYPARPVVKTKGELIGIYSPIHRIGKTRFAMDLGKKLAKKEPVLYLNLEEYSGGGICFPEQTGENLGDLLYYLRQGKGNLGLHISMMVCQDEDLDYLLPMPCVQDLQAVRCGEWLELFDRILEQCIYEKIILDLGDSVDGLFEILKSCRTIYTPYIEECTARAKLSQYAENLRRTGMESVLEKTIQKKMLQVDV